MAKSADFGVWDVAKIVYRVKTYPGLDSAGTGFRAVRMSFLDEKGATIAELTAYRGRVGKEMPDPIELRPS